MASHSSSNSTEKHSSILEDLTFTRRTALALMGAGGFGALATGSAKGKSSGKSGAGNQPWYDWETDVDAGGNGLQNLNALEVNHVYTAARNADRIVWKDSDGVFHADGWDGEIASGEDMIAVINAAIDSLSDGRTSKEKVVVVSPGTVGPADEITQIELPSYTILDAPVTISVEDDGEPLVIPVRSKDAHHIEIENLRITGNPRYGVWLQSVSNVRLGDIRLEHTGVGLGVRIDQYGNTDEICRDVQVDTVFVENAGYHAFETNGVERLQVGKIIGVKPNGAVVNLDVTTDATIGSIIGKDPDVGGGYATFRVANSTHDVTCGQVVSRGGARGIFGVSGCSDITIGEVNIVGADPTGIFIQDCQNFTVDSGVVKNCAAEAIRVDSRTSIQYPPASGVSLSNLRIVDDREDPQQVRGIYESGPRTNNNRFVNNDVRNAGTKENITLFSDSTIVRDNHGGGISEGTVTLTAGNPAARVTGVSRFQESSPSLRAEPYDAPDASFAWESYFVWNNAAGEWDLLFEWKVDPGQDLSLDYIVDQNQASIYREEESDVTVPDPLDSGTYRFWGSHASEGQQIIEVEDASTEENANIQQGSWEEKDYQRWRITKLDGTGDEYKIENVNSGLVAEVAHGSTERGANIRQSTWNEKDHQRWRITGIQNGKYRLEPVHSGMAADVAGGFLEEGTNVLQWVWTRAPNQLFQFEQL